MEKMDDNGKLSQEELQALLGKTEVAKSNDTLSPPTSNRNEQEFDQLNLQLLKSIPLEIVVELGRTKKKINEVLELTNGSIVELEKIAGEPLDVYINNKLIAKGEVVVIDEHFGVRITEICKPVL